VGAQSIFCLRAQGTLATPLLGKIANSKMRRLQQKICSNALTKNLAGRALQQNNPMDKRHSYGWEVFGGNENTAI